MLHLETADVLVLVVYGAVVLGIGAWANRRHRTTEDYLLGGRRMRWWAIGVSLIATSFSSAALIGGTGFGYTTGLSWLQLQIGDLLAITAACFLFLPFFAHLRLTTAYSYLERRFGSRTRTLASALFLAQTLLRTGVLILGPALALAAVSELDLSGAIVVSGLAALAYATTGGITAVVWTDLIQLAVVLFGIGLSLVLIAGDTPGGGAALIEHARATGRLEAVSLAWDWGTPFSLAGAVLAYGTLALSIAGTNQQAVQRYLACRDVGGARRAAILGWAIGFVAIAATLLLGTALHGWGELAPDATSYRAAMDAALDAKHPDAALPLFIVARLPAGVAGLLVAAIFAASMSSMDSAIHAMSTATLVDFVRPRRRRPLTDAQELRLARALTALWGLLAIGAALLAAGQGTQLLDTLITWLGYPAGPLLGLFTLGVLVPFANEAGALLGALLGLLLVAVPVLAGLPAAWGFHPLWLAPLAWAATVGAGAALSPLVGSPPPPARRHGLTWQDRATPAPARE